MGATIDFVDTIENRLHDRTPERDRLGRCGDSFH